MESLEQRVLLAGDIPAWQNPVLPEDVNGDAVVAPDDALLIASELYRTGSRSLLAEPQVEAAGVASAAFKAASTAGAEGEDIPPLFLDVDGDNYLTPTDALLVVRRLVAEGEPDPKVQMRFEITDTTGTSIDSVDVGDPFELDVFVQDVRPDTVADRGVWSAFLDVFYDAPRMSISGPITFGPDYSGLPDQSDVGIDVTSDGTTFVDQSILTIRDDQGRTLNFEFDNDSDLSDPANVRLEFSTSTSALQMADVIVAAINDQTSQGNFSALASNSGTRISVAHDQQINIGSAVQGLELLIRGPGNMQTGLLPKGPEEFLLFTVPFTTDAAPIVAANDNPSTDGTLNVGEDSPAVLVDVLANDTLGGPTELRGLPSEVSPATQVLLFSDPLNPTGTPLPPEEIIYGSDTLQINSTGSLLITDVGPTTGGGTALSASGGTRVQYTPPATSNALGAGETAPDSFSYTASDGFAAATATVTVTIVGENDAPTAEDAGFSTDEDTAIGGSLASLASDPDTNDSLTFSAGTTSTLGAAVTVDPDGTFSYDPTASDTLDALAVGETVDDTFTYVVQDENGGSDTGTVTVTVNGLNDPPLAAGDSGPGFMTDEDTAFVTADVRGNDTDVDGDTLSISGFNATSTAGKVTDNGDGTFGYDPDGQFDFLGPGETAPDSFIYTLSDGNGGTDTATVTITVGGVNDPPEANDDSGPGFTTDEDTDFVTANVLANDSDAEDDPLSITIDTTATLGEVTDNGDGTFGYDPNGQFEFLGAGQNASDFFAYTLSDGSGLTDTATVTITVTGQNDPPTAHDGAAGTDEDTPINDTLAILVDEPDVGDTLYFSIDPSSTPEASVTIDPDGTFTYDPSVSDTLNALALGETVDDTFTYVVEDANGGSDTGTVTITVSGLNDPPEARDDDLFVDEQSSGNLLDVLSNDSDPDSGDTRTVISVGTPDQGGTADIGTDGSAIIYTPDAGFIGVETFSYTIEDGAGATATATVVVDVEALTLPRARNDSFTVAEDSQDNDLNVFINDLISVGGTASISVSKAPDQGGSVVITGPTTLEYTPVENFFGTETFRYTLSDGIGTPEEAVVTVTVTGEPDSPVANDDGGAEYATDEDTLLTTGNVLENDTDADGDTLSVSGIDTAGTAGEVTDNEDGTFDYDPRGQFDWLAEGQPATDTFTYTVSDGNGGTDTATVTISITGLNDPPEAHDDSGPGFETDQGTAFVTENVLTNDTDAEGDPLSIPTINTTGTKGLVTNNDDGTFGYDPDGQFDFLGPGETAPDSFTYTLSDGKGGSDTAVVTITVVGWNDLPEASDDLGTGFTTDEDSDFVTANVLTNDSDTDGGTLSVVSIDTTGTFGQVTDNHDGTFNYDPQGLFEVLGTGDSVTDRFDYTLGDGQGGFDTATVWITINGVNDAPIASNDGGVDFTTDQDTAFVTGNVLDNDRDAENDTLSILSIDTTDTLGQVTDKNDGTFGYDPDGQFDFVGLGETASDTFTYTVSDGKGGTDTATVTVTVTGLNDLPTAQDASFNTSEDAPLSKSLAPWASDPDSNDVLIFSAGDTSALGGTVALDENGTFSYDPTVSGTLQALLPGVSLPDWFTYTVTDGSGETASATATIDVSGVNDAPTAVGDSFPGILEDSSDNVLDVLANDFTDPEPGETLSITSVGPTSAGGTVVNKGSQLEYTPAPNFFGTETFSYTIGDGNGGSATAVVSVAVTSQNDPPTARNDRFGFISGTGPHTLRVLANDTIAPDVGESLTIISTSTPNRGGKVVNQGGQLLYTPPAGVQGEVTETFTYTIGDGSGETDTATVSIDVVGYAPSTLSGFVFIDADRNGFCGPGERRIGSVEVTLTGVDMFGDRVSLARTTSGSGFYWFGNLVPGNYTIRSKQPVFMLDGAEKIGTQGGSAAVNDQLSVWIGGTGGVSGQGNNFGEWGLPPQYVSIWDFLNTSSREGILFATDTQSGQLWFSFLDGWDNFRSATARISANGSRLNLTLVDQAWNTSTVSVPFTESAQLHIRGSVGTRHLVQLLGSAADFGLGAGGLAAEGEYLPDLPEGKSLDSPSSDSPVSRLDRGGPASAGNFEGHASEGAVPVAAPAAGARLADPPTLMDRDLLLAAAGAEGELLPSPEGVAEVGAGLWYELLPSRSPDRAPAAAPLPGLSAADMAGKAEVNPTAGPTAFSTGAEGRLLAVDAVFSSADDGDSWEPLFDGFFDRPSEDNFSTMIPRLFSRRDEMAI